MLWFFGVRDWSRPSAIATTGQSRAERRRRWVPQALCHRQRSTITEKKNTHAYGCLASVIGVEPTAFRLGVQAKCPNYMQNASFYSFLCVLCSIFHPFCIIFCVLKGVFYAFQQVQKQKHYQNITNFSKKTDICGISKPQYFQGKTGFSHF